MRFLAYILPFSVLFLIFAGALVTSHDAGLAVPDWPTTFGQNMFFYPYSEWQGGIFYEHGHRLIASVIGLLTLILTIWILVEESRSWVKKLSLITFAAVVLQGLLGGLTVLFKLPLAVSASHAILAQTFLILTVILAATQSSGFIGKISNDNPSVAKNHFKLVLILALSIYIQLIFGAVMRHSHSGLAIPDFPFFNGYLIPLDAKSINEINMILAQAGWSPVEFKNIIIHSLHRFWAFIVFGLSVLLMFKVYKAKIKSRIFIRLVSLFNGLIFLQMVLGILTVLSFRAPYLTSIHVVTGALTLALVSVMLILVYPIKR